MHPLLRLWPPRGLGGLDVQHALVGHGEGVTDGAAVERALAEARRRIPRWLAGLPRIVRRGY